MHHEIELHLPMYLGVELGWLDSRRYCLNHHLNMIQLVLPTVGVHHLRERAQQGISARHVFA